MFTNHKLSEMVKFSVGLREGRKDPQKVGVYGKIASKGGATKWSLMSGHVSLPNPHQLSRKTSSRKLNWPVIAEDEYLCTHRGIGQALEVVVRVCFMCFD